MCMHVYDTYMCLKCNVYMKADDRPCRYTHTQTHTLTCMYLHFCVCRIKIV